MKLQQTRCCLDFTATDCKTIQIVLLFRETFCHPKRLCPAEVCSRGSLFQICFLSMTNYSKFYKRIVPLFSKYTVCGMTQSVVEIRDACTVKSRFKTVPPQLYFEFAIFFLAQLMQKKSNKFKLKLWRMWFESRFYRASMFIMHEILD